MNYDFINYTHYVEQTQIKFNTFLNNDIPTYFSFKMGVLICSYTNPRTISYLPSCIISPDG